MDTRKTKRRRSSSHKKSSNGFGIYKRVHPNKSSSEIRRLRNTLKAYNEEAGAKRHTHTGVIPYIQRPLQTRDKTDWLDYRAKIESLPIYFISCHSAVCLNYADCGNPEKPGTGYPSLTLPPDTYMINITNGEYCIMSDKDERNIQHNRNDYRNSLLVDTPNDADPLYKYGGFSTISAVYRSSPGSTYPNYTCSFTDKNMGVYDLDDNSIFEDTENKDYYIDEIINKIGKGIYLFGGCTSPLRQTKEYIAPFDYATTLVRNNELSFSALNPTLSISHIKTIDPAFKFVENGKFYSMTAITALNAAALAAAHGTKDHPMHLFDMRSSDLQKAEKLFKRFTEKLDP